MISEIKKRRLEIKERDPFTKRIIACAYRVHSELGPGFNEKIYHNALKSELGQGGLNCETEKQYKVLYDGKQVGMLRIDLIVEGTIIVEVKAITGNVPKLFEAQVLSYLKVTGCKVALLINFGNKSCQVRRLML